MESNINVLFNYFLERENVKINEQEDKAYKLFESSLNATQKRLFIEWEDLSSALQYDEFYFWFQLGFKKGVELFLESISPLKNNP